MSKATFNCGTVLSSRKYKLTEWKNGRGQSTEIAIDPPEAEFSKDPFLWRLSSAQVTQEGPFSQFNGFDRFLALIEGESFLLFLGQSKPPISVEKGMIVRFQGEEEATCKLPNGAIRDLNLIFDRNKVNAHFKMIHLENKPRSFKAEGNTVLLLSLSGSFRASIYPNGKTYSILNFDTLHLKFPNLSSQSENLVMLESKTPQCNLVWIELEIRE